MAVDPPEELVAPDDLELSAVVLVGGSDAEQLLAEVREAVATGREVVVAPDSAAPDPDEWIALVSVSVVEGAAGVHTRYPREAQRILDVHRAILTGGSEVGG